MRCSTLLLLSLAALALAGCKKQNEELTAHGEEPYTPTYTSLDAMDAAPATGTTTYEPPPAQPAMDVRVAPTDAGQPDEPLSPVGSQLYTVQKGDTLYQLARRFYNDQARWRDIWEANRDRISNPDRLSVGMQLVIP